MVSNLAVLFPFVLEWLKTLFLDIIIQNGSSVVGCFLDASKAFDSVDHGIFFKKLSDRGLPLAVVKFLLSWYSSQECCVHWGSCFSRSFSVSNGVRHRSVLSPLLFALYLDGLLSALVESGVGCYWGNMFAGCLCYVDDIVLLAPCQSAPRIMLKICCDYASNHGLEFNSSKSQLICFRKSSHCTHPISIHMNGQLLRLSDEVCHLGHILSFNLCDRNDILRATKNFNRKSNYILRTFNCADPSVKSFLVKISVWLPIWSLSSPDLNILQVAVNYLLRRIWRLLCQSHSAICHCLSVVPAIINQVMKRFLSLYSTAMSSSSPLVKAVFSTCSSLAFSFTGYNFMYGANHVRVYSDSDSMNASFIFDICKRFPFISPFESLIYAA